MLPEFYLVLPPTLSANSVRLFQCSGWGNWKSTQIKYDPSILTVQSREITKGKQQNFHNQEKIQKSMI